MDEYKSISPFESERKKLLPEEFYELCNASGFKVTPDQQNEYRERLYQKEW